MIYMWLGLYNYTCNNLVKNDTIIDNIKTVNKDKTVPLNR